MSKKKTEQKKAEKGKKKDSKSGAQAGKKAAARPAAKGGASGKSKNGKSLKTIVTKVVKAVAKKVLTSSKPKSDSSKTKNDNKTASKNGVSKKPAKGSAKPAATSSKLAIKTSRPAKQEPASKLKPAVSVPAKKENKKPAVNAAVKAKKQEAVPASKAQERKAADKTTQKPEKQSQKKEPAIPNAGSSHKASQNGTADKAGRKLSDLFEKKGSGKKQTDVLAVSNTIPVKAKSEISPSKIASISYSITNPVKRTDSYAVKAEKEPAGKFEMEFVVHASAEMLYEFLSTPSGLSEWFCDDLNIRNGIYTFIWDDQLQQARLLKTVDQQLVRFQWVDKTDGSYFEFRIQRDDLTNDVSLIITDFAETASERDSSKLLWNSQVEKLMHVIGSIF